MAAAAAPSAGKSGAFDTGSFRDRSGRVIESGGRILRALSAPALESWRQLQATEFFRREVSRGRLVRTHAIDPPVAESSQWPGWLEHERVPFISYPYEWPFGMLQSAALLQLELMQAALAEALILKDASPFNVQFRGVDPVFIDIGSFEPHDGGPWVGYRQFCQMFLYPLMLRAWRGIDFHPWLRGRLGGIEPEECWRILGARHLWRRGVLTHVFLHSKLSSAANQSRASIPDSLQASGFRKSLIESNVAKLQRLVAGLRWKANVSTWTNYDQASAPVALDAAAKEEFVRSVVARRSTWELVWDLGCNLGRYSRIAADRATQVLALDSDHLVVERLYRVLRDEGRKNVLPLVFNVADPSPGLGWRGAERKPLAERGRPQLVLCLALIHHLVLSENLLLAEVLDWLASLGGELVIEFVDKSDPQVRQLLAHRVDQFSDYDREGFVRLLEERFEVRDRLDLPSGTRTLFWATPRSDT